MRSHKLGVIVVASREFLNYTQFFEAMKPQIAEQFYKKFDEAGLLNVDNPFAQSLEQSVKTSGNVVNGPITLENVLSLEDELLEQDVEANAFLSKTQNRTALRGVRDENTNESYYDRSSNTLDGLPVVDLKSDEIKKATYTLGTLTKCSTVFLQYVLQNFRRWSIIYCTKRRWFTSKLIRTRINRFTCNYGRCIPHCR